MVINKLKKTKEYSDTGRRRTEGSREGGREGRKEEGDESEIKTKESKEYAENRRKGKGLNEQGARKRLGVGMSAT